MHGNQYHRNREGGLESCTINTEETYKGFSGTIPNCETTVQRVKETSDQQYILNLSYRMADKETVCWNSLPFIRQQNWLKPGWNQHGWLDSVQNELAHVIAQISTPCFILTSPNLHMRAMKRQLHMPKNFSNFLFCHPPTLKPSLKISPLNMEL